MLALNAARTSHVVNNILASDAHSVQTLVHQHKCKSIVRSRAEAYRTTTRQPHEMHQHQLSYFKLFWNLKENDHNKAA